MIRPADFPARAQYTVHKYHLQIPLFPGNAWRAKYIPWRNYIVALKDVDESRSLKRLYEVSVIEQGDLDGRLQRWSGVKFMVCGKEGAPRFYQGVTDRIAYVVSIIQK